MYGPFEERLGTLLIGESRIQSSAFMQTLYAFATLSGRDIELNNGQCEGEDEGEVGKT